ncbi:MAG TPA: FAD-dependent oxidoreductase [Roseiflexaceae bacterium]|nr:FAD-dependent oxidoreductase [Roseiflexaceae bacterium]
MSSETPLSYWQQARTARSAPAEPLPAQVDLAVVGGGLLGVACAYWLARAGHAPLLLERDVLAAGATGRNGGLMVVGTAEDYPGAIARLGHQTARRIWALTEQSVALLHETLIEERIDCAYCPNGHLQLALDPEQQRRQERTAGLLREDGFGVELLDRAAVQALIDTPLGPQIAGGLMLPGGRLHSGRLVWGLAEAAERHGAQIREGVACLEIAQDGAGVRIVTTAGVVQARTAVVAANAWLGALLPALAGLVTPVRGQVLAYAPTQPVFSTGGSAAVTPTGEYWQQTADGSIVIGGCRADASGRDVGITSATPSPEVQGAIERVLPGLFPDLALPPVALRWAGLMAFTPDYTPVAGPLPDEPGIWAVGGFSGHGMPFGLILGRLLAEALGGHARAQELHPFRIDRF